MSAIKQINLNKATARPWKARTHSVLSSAGFEIASCNTSRLIQRNNTNAALIVQAVNEYDALNSVADHCEKLRLCINALLTELPDNSIVNGEDNFPFRLKILKAQVGAEKAQANLAAVRKGKSA